MIFSAIEICGAFFIGFLVSNGDSTYLDLDHFQTDCPTQNGTQDSRPYLPYILECTESLEQYCQQLRETIASLPSAPTLVADSLTANSLRLKWDDEKIQNVTYSMQWKYEQTDAMWQYSRNQSWGTDNMIKIFELQPYTKYRFRVALVLEHCNRGVSSEPSRVINTLPGDIPSSPPLIVSAAATDPTRISLSWQPGPFPNAPILSYILQINELPVGYAALKDIPVLQDKSQQDFYMFENLAPSRNYTISIAMRNEFGTGPPATIIVCTPAASNDLRGKDTPVLILASHHTIEKSQAVDMFEKVEELFKTKHVIKGVAIHVRSELLFVSDSSGSVFMCSSSHFADPYEVLPPGAARPLDISVDWLNNHLYILQKITLNSSASFYQIVQTTLNGSNLTVAAAGFPAKPHHIEVDPYNGYLFWVVKGVGLYRLDLADINRRSYDSEEDMEPSIILENPNLGAFTVDYTNFQLIVPVHSVNTVISISLDGKEMTDLRKNTQRPQFQDVKSLAMANGLFYWTNGEKILTEEYHPGQKSFFHNGYKEFTRNCPLMAIMVSLPSSQPIPVPVNAPESVQAIMSSTLAKVSWEPPHRLGSQGKGSWQGWSYKLSLRFKNNEELIKNLNMSTTKYILTNLIPGTEYTIRVAAVTTSGQGPWSSEFKGQTMTRSASILWSTTRGLLASDVTGDNVKTLITKDNLKEGYESYRVNDIAWIRDKLFLVSNTSHIHWFNLTDNTGGELRGIDSVGSISVDWIGNRLYWSNPKQQMITRSNLDGSQPEILPIITVAKELNVDSVGGYLYWSTGHAVEIAHLNGKQKRSLYPSEPFSGKKVIGLTLDMEDRSVYWIVRSYEGSSLFKSLMAHFRLNNEVMPKLVITLLSANLQGPLRYLDGHLLWLQDSNTTVIGDKNCTNTAVLSLGTLSGLNTVHVLDPNVHTYPDSIKVIPGSVDKSSIQVEGTFKQFNITWNPVTNVNFGEVFYEIKVKHLDGDIETELTDVFVTFKGARPYTPLKISIRPFTYWASAVPTLATVHSPQSAPSLPLNTRIFVEHLTSPLKTIKNVRTTFRWAPPASLNGIITSYRLFYYYTDQSNCKMNHEVSMNTFEYSTLDIPFNVIVHFQVSACTKGGCSDYTLDVNTNTIMLTPIPKLLFFSSEALVCLDFDNHTTSTIFSTSSAAIDFAANFFENQVYWIDHNKIMWSSSLTSPQKIKLTLLNGTGQAMAVDWISRTIFWSESDSKQSNMFAYNLNNGTVSSLFSRQLVITSLQVAPFHSLLLWTEEDGTKKNDLLRSGYDGSNIQQFFNFHSNSRKRRNTCDCPKDSLVGRVLSVEHFEGAEARVLWYDEEHKTIWSTDTSGCFCENLINSVENQPGGLPLTSLTSDSKYIYWSSFNRQIIFSASESNLDSPAANDSPLFSSFSSVEISKIIALGSHLQPYPDAKCLIPSKHSSGVTMLNKTDHSVILKLPTLEKDESCVNVASPINQYTIYYGSISDNSTSRCAVELNDCLKIMTYETVISIEDLKAFEQYVFRVSIQNYFSDLELSDPLLGPLTVFQTAIGAPPPPQNLSGLALSPNKIWVEWNHVTPFKSIRPSFLVLWTAKDNDVRHKGEISVPANYSYSENKLSTTLTKLHADLIYQIKVRAFFEDDIKTYSESSFISLATYPEPHDLVLNLATPYSLNISWLGERNYPYTKYCLEFCEASLIKWTVVTKLSKDSFYILTGLSPKMHYTFRLAITFSKSVQVFIWPPDNRFSFVTLGDKPTPPGTPFIQSLFGAIYYKIAWEASRDNGGVIEFYALEGRQQQLFGDGAAEEVRNESLSLAGNSTVSPHDWTLYYNGTDNYWIIKELSPLVQYQFRVRSKNSYGWSNYSQMSDIYDVNASNQLIIHERKAGVPLWIFVTSFVIFMLMFLLCLVRFFRRSKGKKCNIFENHNGVAGRSGSDDAELATLRELPRHPNFIENTNILYASSDNYFFNDEELNSLPHIRRDQITLTKFLGSGAFGEVFEGVAKNISIFSSTEELIDHCETKVAIKTLRRRASGQERAEFLKEALLMSNFKHTHILQLLGVCLDNNPAFIIMELMEGGDLLSYLRLNRPRTTTNIGLTLDDLISISLDVVKGCCYLEEMHFVHRDLACRNCLVSSHNPCERIVKIGDFGLARDIYKNDYYRKEGEGLLPVRWMAPESLVDGVFTTQSDIWSYGVLVWEILTLGQRPYPARSNLEVLHFVRTGGRLDKPCNASEQLYELMQLCWSFSPSDRPTFRYCLNVLDSIKQTCNNTPLVVEYNDYLSLEIEVLDEASQEVDSQSLRRLSLSGSGDISASPPKSIDSRGYLELMSEEISDCAAYEQPMNKDTCEQVNDTTTAPKELMGPASENNNFSIFNRNQTFDVS